MSAHFFFVWLQLIVIVKKITIKLQQRYLMNTWFAEVLLDPQHFICTLTESFRKTLSGTYFPLFYFLNM